MIDGRVNYLEKLFILSIGLLVSHFSDAATYQYDGLDRIIKIIYENNSSITYAYDSSGNIQSVIKAGLASGTLLLSLTPSTGGSLQAIPVGTNPVTAGSSTRTSYASGTSVQITATPSSGYSFQSWAGDCSGNATTCTVTMSQARNVFATFTANGGSNLSGVGGRTASGNAPNSVGVPGAGRPVTITASGGGTGQWIFTRAAITTAAAIATPPAGVDFPNGLADLELALGQPGTPASVVINYSSALPDNTVYWKFGRTVDNTTRHWYVLPAAQAVISPDRRSITLTLTDGGLGDDDLQANGVIDDPGGPGNGPSDPQGIPSLSKWGMSFLAGLIALLGMLRARRRKGEFLRCAE